MKRQLPGAPGYLHRQSTDPRWGLFAAAAHRIAPVLRAGVSLLLSVLGLWLVLLFLSGSKVVEATPPIEDNPISMGAPSEVLSASMRVRAIAAADLDRNGRPD